MSENVVEKLFAVPALRRQEALTALRAHKDALKERFGVSKIALFGSVARDETEPNKDVDAVVWFERPITFRNFYGTMRYLEEVLGRTVDLTTEAGIRSGFRSSVERDLVDV